MLTRTPVVRIQRAPPTAGRLNLSFDRTSFLLSAGKDGAWMEIMAGIERRRRWRPEEKLSILVELDTPGVTVAEVARRHKAADYC